MLKDFGGQGCFVSLNLLFNSFIWFLFVFFFVLLDFNKSWVDTYHLLKEKNRHRHNLSCRRKENKDKSKQKRNNTAEKMQLL